jgi:arylsulfatase A-like enzyme
MKIPLAIAFLAVLDGLASTAPAAENRPPNLIVIITDDLGYADTGFNGCKDIPTPHIDSIASNGARFTDGYVTYAVCSPSRAGLLTGRYQQRFGHERNPKWSPGNPKSGLPLSETTLADALGKSGYHTGAIGKWHLGCHPDLHPLKRGFRGFFGHLAGGHRYFPDELTLRETRQAKHEGDSYQLWIERDNTPVRTSKYLTDEFSDEAVRFIGNHHAKPFFLYLAYNAPHTPLQAGKKYLSRFPHIGNERRRTYAAMVSAVDDGIGRILAELREHGIENHTMLVFHSDNGGPTGDNASDNGPLRGAKGSPWEGGIRVPFAMQWPQQIPKGLVYRHPVSSLDIFATIAGPAGVTPHPERPLDGVDLLPYLNGAKTDAPHQAIFLRMFDKGTYAVRSGDLKLVIEAKGRKPELYDLAKDIGERDNLAATRPDDLARLEKLRLAWDARLVPPAFAGLNTGKKPKAK